jgi:hypothetical protein
MTKKAKKKSPAKKPAAKKKVAVKKGPRQTSLPGMEDRRITALDNAALSYAEIRDQRMELSKSEVEAKSKVSDLMHANKKTHYKHGNIVIDLVPEGEKVKVKIKPEGEEDDEPDTADVQVSAGDPEPAEDVYAEDHEEETVGA